MILGIIIPPFSLFYHIFHAYLYKINKKEKIHPRKALHDIIRKQVKI